MKTSGSQKRLESQPNLYQELVDAPPNEEISSIIKIDIPRTFPENIYFEIYKPGLYNVLAAYANHNKSVGYCQGLNPERTLSDLFLTMI
jgi:TBC1 domain family member 6